MSQDFSELYETAGSSQALRATIDRARTYAREQGHRKVTLEHLLLALSEDQDAGLVLQACQVDFLRLKHDVGAYLGRLDDRVLPGQPTEPAPHDDLLRIFRVADAAAKQRSRSPNGGLVLAAIVGDARSPAANMLRSQGLTFDEAVRALQAANAQLRAGQAVPSGAAPAQPNPASPQPGQIPNPQPGSLPRTAPPEPTANAGDAPLPQPRIVRTQPDAANAPEPTAPPKQPAADPQLPLPPRSRVPITPLSSAPASSAGGASQSNASAPPPRQQGTAPQGRPPQPSPAPNVGQTGLPRAPVANPSPTPSPAPSPSANEQVLADARRKVAAGGLRPGGPTDTARAPADRVPDGGLARLNRPRSNDGHGDDPMTAPPAGAPPQGRAPQPGAPPAGQSAAPRTPGTRPAATPPAWPPAPGAGHPQAGRTQAPPTPQQPGQPPGASRPPPAQPAPNQPSTGPSGRLHEALPPRTQPPGPAGPGPGPRPPLPQPGAGRPSPQDVPRDPSALPRPDQGRDMPTPPPGAPRQAQPPAGAHGAPDPRPPVVQGGQSVAAGEPRTQPPTGGRRQNMPVPVPAASRETGALPDETELMAGVPRRMRSGTAKTVEVRIARQEIEAITREGQTGSSKAPHHIATQAMTVRLRAPEGGFFIEPIAIETQWIDRRPALQADDYAIWRWSVTPRKRGRRELQLAMSLRRVTTDGHVQDIALPSERIDVRVAGNMSSGLKTAFGWFVAALIGAGLAVFSGPLLGTLLSAIR